MEVIDKWRNLDIEIERHNKTNKRNTQKEERVQKKLEILQWMKVKQVYREASTLKICFNIRTLRITGCKSASKIH